MGWHTTVLVWAALVPAAGAADWVKIKSSNFDLLTNAGEHNGRETLTVFENARAFFLREQPFLVDSLPPASIVSFNHLREYRPYRPHGSALAYFLKREAGDYIVTSYLLDDETRVAVHEYAHLVIEHSGLSLPVWLNEGIAEVYSTLEPDQGKLVVGRMKKDRLVSLGSENWMRLPLLLRADRTSREYNEADRVGIFYAESCLLTHMLMLDDAFKRKFPRFVERVSVTGSSEAAIREVYGRSTAEMEMAMRTYFRQMIQGAAVYPAQSANPEIGPARPATETEIGVTLATLTAHLGKTAEAKGKLLELAAAHPGNPEIEAGLGTVELLGGNKDAALAHYRSAIEHGAPGWGVHWAYARLLDDMRGELPPRVQALTEVLRRNPELVEARLLLGRNLFADGRYSEAQEQIQMIKPLPTAYASEWHVEMARIALALKQPAQSREHLEKARSAARTPVQSESVEHLASLIERGSAEAVGSRDAAPDGEPDPGRPTLRRKSPPPAKKN